MTFEDYQKKSRKTAMYPKVAGNGWVYPALGLASEAGEVANKLKKVIRDAGGQIDSARRDDIADELGDVLWYVAQLATELDLDMGQLAESNIDKLYSRLDRGTIGGSGDKR
jgi:NTP pyrophosphatase (non-canonical NTP hydrolase)